MMFVRFFAGGSEVPKVEFAAAEMGCMASDRRMDQLSGELYYGSNGGGSGFYTRAPANSVRLRAH